MREGERKSERAKEDMKNIHKEEVANSLGSGTDRTRWKESQIMKKSTEQFALHLVHHSVQ